MTTYYNINPKFYVSVDCIIFGFDEGELKLLLLKRNFEPAMGKWSLMGGFVQEDESVDAAAKRVLAELTGLENVYMEQVGTFGDLERDPGERVISVAYYALVNVNEYDRELVQQHNAHWTKIDELPQLIFDHPIMISKARELMKHKASYNPIGFNLLPELFTLTQLQNLYEAIYGEPMDERTEQDRTGQNRTEQDKTDRADRTDEQETEQPNEWTNGRMDERTEQDRADRAGRTSRETKQRDEADRQSRQTADTSHRHSEDSQNTGLNHVAGEKKRQSRPGETGRERRPGAETGSRADGSGSDGSRSDGSGSTKKTIRNQRTIISVCPSALTLCDARQ